MVSVPQGGITLAGANFTPSSIVLFDGASAPTFYQNASTLEFQLPGSSFDVAQVHTVQVTDPRNGQSNVATYEVYTPQPGPDVFVGTRTEYISEGLLVNSLVPDLNSDGKADLVVLASPAAPPSTLLIRYGQADGTFSAPNSAGSFTLEVDPHLISAGDFNGDGHTDLILIAGGSYQALLNDGTGHFNSAGTGVLPSSPFGFAVVGDFNHDGKLDFACTGSAGGTQPFSLFFGKGDGTFNAPVAVGAAGANPRQTIAADLNHDGYTDLVYANQLPSGQQQLRILLSVGDGSFMDIAPAGLPNPVVAFVVGDFNNDHIPDLFIVDARGLGQAYLGAGNGAFTPTGNPFPAYDGYLVQPPFVAADFDNDGNMDVATRASLAGPDEIVFFFGDGQGNFAKHSVVSDHSFTLQVGDVNGDGIADIFAGAEPGFAYPSVVLGRSDRNFPSPQILIPQTLGELSAGDVFHDGFTDLLVGGSTNGLVNFPGTIYHIQSDGTFAPEGQPPDYPSVLVDLNGDGIADMVGFSGETLLIWQGDGSGVFQTPVNEIQLPGGFNPIYFRDMDLDGHMDIVVPGLILYGRGNFQFDAVPVATTHNFLLGDFDGDGIPDIATSSGVLFGQGNRSFTAPTGSTYLPTDPPPFSTQAVGDLNRDGMDDIIETYPGDSTIAIYLSVGRQGFVFDQQVILYGYYPTPSSLTIADFNGDGLNDIASGMVGGGDDVVLFSNDGTGKYQITSYAIGIYGVQSLAADFNRDAKPDLAFLSFKLDYEPPTVTVLMHK